MLKSIVVGSALMAVSISPGLSRLAHADPAPPKEIPLWSGVAPGSEGKAGPETTIDKGDGQLRVATIHKPAIIPYLPRKKRTGAAVVILPGGGHRYLAIDNEGHNVAKWLRDRGVAAFVLKYRLAREEGSTYTVEKHALMDVHRAVRLVRSRAKKWQIDPARVGVIGFSAGGQLANLAGLRYDAGKPTAKDPAEKQSARPAFMGLMYAGMPKGNLDIPKDVPPTFICVAADDKGAAENALVTFQQLRGAGAVTELHVYAQGGHGFGMKERPDPITQWPTRFLEWLDSQHLLTKTGGGTKSASLR